MDQIRRLYANLSVKQRIYILTAGLAVLGGIFYFIHYQREKDFVPLYTGLSAEDAGVVVQRLKEGAVEYRLSADSTTVRVPSAKVPDLRLQMAAAGIPKTGRIGFELFDRTNFGLTEFAEQVNYHRALEGELERTVMTVAEVESARVHITPSKDSVFLDQRRPAKASVLLKLKIGAALSAKNVKAITHLLASGVEGLSPENVSVLDVHGNLLTRPQTAQGSEQEILNESLLAYKRNLERDLLSKVNATLEPLLGAERFRASVSVDCDLSDSEQSEETYDPSKSVMTTSQRSEDSAGSKETAGVPGTASNLPRPTSRPTAVGQGLSRRTENINFASSRMVKRVRMPQGNLRRISVSVLLDHTVRWDGNGPNAKRIVEPPPAERLKATRDVVSGVVGFQQDRGDLLIVESIPFEQTLAVGRPAPPPAPAATAPAAPAPQSNLFQDLLLKLKEAVEKKNMTILGPLAGGLVVLLGGIAFAIFRRRRKKKVASVAGPAALAAQAAPSSELPLPGSGASVPIIELPEGSDIDEKFHQELSAKLAEKQRQEELLKKGIITELTSNLKTSSSASKKSEVLGKQMMEVAKKQPDTLANIVRTWMSDGDVERI